MQETRRSHLHSPQWRPPQRAWAWPAVIFGAVAAWVAWLVSASVVWAVVFLLMGCAPFVLMAAREARRNNSLAVSSDAPGYWQDWLAGWYWQTDEFHRLVVLKPDQSDSASWQSAQSWVQSEKPLWACWELGASPLTPGHRMILSMIEMRMKSRLALDMDELPWPVVAGGAANAMAASNRCILKGVPRFDGHGQFLGYHGVWHRGESTPASSALTPGAEPAPASVAEITASPEVKEAEQEMLRYALSHDLRAPLRVVDGFARILKEDYCKSLDRLGNDHLDRVLAAAARMNGMIDAILAQAQLSQSPVQRAHLDLSAMAHEVAQEQLVGRLGDQAAAGQAAVTVDVDITEGLLAEADPALVRRVLDNLIGNALKYSSKVAQPRIEVGMVPATVPEVYFVSDNGAGFDMQHADKLFGLFQRLHSTKEFPGTGVGLAGVQNIIHRHGGRVWAEAAPGQGACFYFTLQPSVATATLGKPASSVHRPEA